MVDLYVCSDCSKTYRDEESIARHWDVTGHGLEDPTGHENEFWEQHYADDLEPPAVGVCE